MNGRALRQAKRFLDFAEDIEYYGSLHGGLPLDEKITQMSAGLSEKGLSSLHDLFGMPA